MAGVRESGKILIELDLEIGDKLTVGRNSGGTNELNVSEYLPSELAAYISERHCEIDQVRGAFYVADLTKKHRTLLQGRALKYGGAFRIQNEDIITLLGPNEMELLKIQFYFK